jgi:ADP-dependent NAD(P)H-hydrate dehydratase / NAD(P)H-hydrate epimerase
MLVTCAQMRDAEERAFASGVSAAALMDEAGRGCADVVRTFCPRPGALVLYLGSGNNAGDALVAARELVREGWRLYARLSCEPEQMKNLPQRHWRELPELRRLQSPADLPEGRGPLVLLDGLLGIGAKGELRPPLRELAAEMNALRQSRYARIFALDLPTGLDGDTGRPTADTVIADVTAVIGCMKTGLVADSATPHVGRLCLVPLKDLSCTEGDAAADILTPHRLRSWLPRRAYETHKGQVGRVGVVAGSRGFLGAARLVCEGALRAGAGLVTLVVKEELYPLMAPLLPPEVMVKPVADFRAAVDLKLDAMAVGPGVGFADEGAVMDLLAHFTGPAVVDADALTMVARQGLDSVRRMRGTRLLTPHPGEMIRLTAARADWQGLNRRMLAESVAAALPGHVCLYKGARTVIAQAGERTLFNTTGHPGMATGGMGDALTGVCAGWLGQGVSAYRAAALGAWLNGRAAELCGMSAAEESVLPSDVLQHLGVAMAMVRETIF